MDRPRILLLETDVVLESVLSDIFADENLDVTLCGSPVELRAAVEQFPRAAVVSDSWDRDVDLGAPVEVVLTSLGNWASHTPAGEQGGAQVVAEPFTVEHLMATIRAALARSSSGG